MWISETVEGYENVKRDKTVEFVKTTKFVHFCWICGNIVEMKEKYENVNFVHFWICGTLNEIRLWNQIKQVLNEIDENVNEIKQLNLLHGWICGNIDWDMNEKLVNTTEFVTLLNMWDCWMKLVSWIK